METFHNEKEIFVKLACDMSDGIFMKIKKIIDIILHLE